MNAKISNRELNSLATPLWDAYFLSRGTPQEIDCRNAIAVHYLPFVTDTASHLAKKLPYSCGLTPEDCAGICARAMLESIPRFRPSLASFTSLLSIRLSGEIKDELRELDFLSRTARAKVIKEKAFTPRFYSIASGRRGPPRAGGAGGASEDEDMSYQDLFADKRTPLASYTELDQSLLAACTDRERTILTLYYRDGKTHVQISQATGLSETRISQLHARSLRSLAERLRLGEERKNGECDPNRGYIGKNRLPGLCVPELAQRILAEKQRKAVARIERETQLDSVNTGRTRRRYNRSAHIDEFLKANCSSMTTAQLAAALAMKPHALYYHFRRLNISPLPAVRQDRGLAPPRNKQQRHRFKLRSLGLCGICGKPPGRFVQCLTCRKKRSLNRRERLTADGLRGSGFAG